MKYDVCVIGGCGHVGLPLGLCLANEGRQVAALDVDQVLIQQVNSGEMPFKEDGGPQLLQKVLAAKKFCATDNPDIISQSEHVIFVIGTPVTGHLYPAYADFFKSIRHYFPYLRDDQLLILRSTLYPGVSEKVHQMLQEYGLKMDVAFCPERISQGNALKELYELPQIVASFSPSGIERARRLFCVFNNDFMELTPIEAEFAKLFTNTWRYIRFAVANQFFMIANSKGLDFYKIYEAMTHNYPRIKDMPQAGFAAGPCLYKDTLQLAASTGNTFFLGHSALLVNEGLPDYIVECLKKRMPLHEKAVGILGMAFKKDSDDRRESLAYKLKNILTKECRALYTTDPFLTDEEIMPVHEVVAKSDVLILGAPHSAYADLAIEDREVVDIWNFFGNGTII